VRSVGVVVDPPFLDDLTSLVEVCKQVLVEAFVAQPAVEAFDKAVLHRLAGRDVVPLDSKLLLPGQDRIRGELGAVAPTEGRICDRRAGARSLLLQARTGEGGDGQSEFL